MERYLLISLTIIGFWVLGFLVYLAISNRQLDIETEIDHVNTLLETGESGDLPQ